MATYEVLIEYDELTYYPDGMIRGYDRQRIYLDQVGEVIINSTSDLTTHPMLNGDLVADHIIKKPITLSLSGTFSMNGSTRSDLIQKQTLFENIKNNGWFCHISKINTNTNKPCFIKRNNLILTSIRWTEGINSVSYSFGFDQVIVSNELGYTQATGQYLPETTIAEWSDLNLSADISVRGDEVLKLLWKAGVIDEGMYNFVRQRNFAFGGFWEEEGKFYQNILNIPKFIVDGIVNYIDGYKYVYSVSALANEINEKKILQIVSDIQSQVNKVTSMASIYTFTTSKNQKVILPIDNEYYQLSIQGSKTSNEWLLSLETLYTPPKIIFSNKSTSAKINYFSDMSSSNRLCMIGNKHLFIWYVRNTATSAVTDLRQYSIVVSPILYDDLNKMIDEIIESYINGLK